jgi:predicted nuclease with TOPRIM domain
MSIFDFISEKEQEQQELKDKLKELEGRRALIDPHQQSYKLLAAAIKDVQIKLSYLEKEISAFVLENSK